MSAAIDVARKPDGTPEWRPYIARGGPRTTRSRPTIADPPDRRVPEPRRRLLAPAELRMATRDTGLDPRFRATDRWLWRWAVGQGDIDVGLVAASIEMRGRVSELDPLPEEEAVTTDLVLLHSPAWARDFAFMWFRSKLSVDEIAARLKCRTRAVFDERKLALAYFLGRLTEAGIKLPTWEPI